MKKKLLLALTLASLSVASMVQAASAGWRMG